MKKVENQIPYPVGVLCFCEELSGFGEVFGSFWWKKAPLFHQKDGVFHSPPVEKVENFLLFPLNILFDVFHNGLGFGVGFDFAVDGF